MFKTLPCLANDDFWRVSADTKMCPSTVLRTGSSPLYTCHFYGCLYYTKFQTKVNKKISSMLDTWYSKKVLPRRTRIVQKNIAAKRHKAYCPEGSENGLVGLAFSRRQYYIATGSILVYAYILMYYTKNRGFENHGYFSGGIWESGVF